MTEEASLLSVMGLRDAQAPYALTLRVDRGQLVYLSGGEPAVLSRAARLIAGRAGPAEGAVWLSGRAITNDWPDAKRLSFVSGGAGPLFAARRRGEALRALGLSAEGLNGAELRFALRLARALKARPAMLVADASAPSLGEGLRLRLLDAVREACREGMGALWLSGGLAGADGADLVALTADGRVIQSGPLREIYERPLSVRAARMSGECILLDGRVEAVKGSRVLFITQGLNIPCRSNLWLAPGERATLFLRPEWLRWSRERVRGFSPPLPAQVKEAAAGPEGLSLRFSLPGGTELSIRRADGEGETPKAGEHYDLWWDTERALLLPPEDEE